MGKDKIAGFVAQDTALKAYRYPLDQILHLAPHTLDAQGEAPRIPDDYCSGRRSPQGQAQRARAEPDAAAGRGTRDGCRGRCEDQCRERASHLPITVNVSVAV